MLYPSPPFSQCRSHGLEGHGEFYRMHASTSQLRQHAHCQALRHLISHGLLHRLLEVSFWVQLANMPCLELVGGEGGLFPDRFGI